MLSDAPQARLVVCCQTRHTHTRYPPISTGLKVEMSCSNGQMPLWCETAQALIRAVVIVGNIQCVTKS